jgi:hypothetical protein
MAQRGTTNLQRLPDLRHCLRTPIAEVAEAATLLDEAVWAHLEGNPSLASEFISRADMPAISDWASSILGKE